MKRNASTSALANMDTEVRKIRKNDVDTRDPSFKLTFAVNKNNVNMPGTLVHYKWFAQRHAPQLYLSMLLQDTTGAFLQTSPLGLHCRTTAALVSLDRDPPHFVAERQNALQVLRETLLSSIQHFPHEDAQAQTDLINRYTHMDIRAFGEEMGHVTRYDFEPGHYIPCTYYDSTMIHMCRNFDNPPVLASSVAVRTKPVPVSRVSASSGGGGGGAGEPVPNRPDAIDANTEEVITKKCYEIMANVFENVAKLIRETHGVQK